MKGIKQRTKKEIQEKLFQIAVALEIVNLAGSLLSRMILTFSQQSAAFPSLITLAISTTCFVLFLISNRDSKKSITVFAKRNLVWIVVTMCAAPILYFIAGDDWGNHIDWSGYTG